MTSSPIQRCSSHSRTSQSSASPRRALLSPRILSCSSERGVGNGNTISSWISPRKSALANEETSVSESGRCSVVAASIWRAYPARADVDPPSPAGSTSAERLQAVGDQAGERERGGCGRGGGVAEMDCPLGLVNHEVLDQSAVAAEGLGADPGRTSLQVGGPERRNEAAGLAHERPAAGGPTDLGQGSAAVTGGEPPAPRPRQRLREVGGADPRQPVGVACGRHQRAWPEQDLAVDSLRQVSAEKGKLGVGNRIDA